MKAPELLLLVGAISIFMQGQATAATRSRSQGSTRPSKLLVSPDGRHQLSLSGSRVRLNGKPVACRPGKVLGNPVWRADSRAVAFLKRSRHGVQLVVLPSLNPRHPLEWQLPLTVDRLKKVFWLAEHRLGVGAKLLQPRLVVSWTSSPSQMPLW